MTEMLKRWGARLMVGGVYGLGLAAVSYLVRSLYSFGWHMLRLPWAPTPGESGSAATLGGAVLMAVAVTLAVAAGMWTQKHWAHLRRLARGPRPNKPREF